MLIREEARTRATATAGSGKPVRSKAQEVGHALTMPTMWPDALSGVRLSLNRYPHSNSFRLLAPRATASAHPSRFPTTSSPSVLSITGGWEPSRLRVEAPRASTRGRSGRSGRSLHERLRSGFVRPGLILGFSLPLLMVSGCRTRELLPRKPNVLLVVFDTTRADDWSYLDDVRPTTPTLDAIAERGYRFSNSWSLYTWTVPSHVSLFTGREVEASAAGAEFIGSSLFTVLGRNGYRTYAFSGNDNLRRETIDALRPVEVSSEHFHSRTDPEEIDRLLGHYREYVLSPMLLPEARRRAYLRNRRVMMGSAAAVDAEALGAMRAHASAHVGEPFFLFLNYNDAHDPYFPPPPFDERFTSDGSSDFNGNLWSRTQREPPPPLDGMLLSMTARGLSEADIERARALHLGEVAYADARFGELLAELEKMGLLENTVVVLTSDHGELFGEHGRMAHGGRAHDELLRVPLVIAFPDADLSGGRVDERVDLRDVKPTLLDYLGIADASSRGRSLMPHLRYGEALPPPALFEPAADDPTGNLIEGQDPATREQLLDSLRALGYVE
jgi:arylsulfatase A-like enzyme